MNDYPKERPTTLDDVRRGHIVGKVTNVNQHNSLWLRDALDVTLAEIARLRRRDRATFMAGFDAGSDVGWEAAKDDSSGVPNPGGAFLALEAYEEYLGETTKDTG